MDNLLRRPIITEDLLRLQQQLNDILSAQMECLTAVPHIPHPGTSCLEFEAMLENARQNLPL